MIRIKDPILKAMLAVYVGTVKLADRFAEYEQNMNRCRRGILHFVKLNHPELIKEMIVRLDKIESQHK